MPKLTLTYDLDTERNAAEIAVKSLDCALAWVELRDYIRERIKYGNLAPGASHALEGVRDKMSEIEIDQSLPEVE